jgi:maltose/moltooligosaccharide transporter
MMKKHAQIYTAGTLRYTARAVFWLFFWMLLGSFVFSMLERIIPILLPLTFKQFGCSNQTIGLLVGSLPSALNILINPGISFKSDRLRSKWGRRIPFLVSATPFAAIFLMLIGWAPLLGEWISGILNGIFPPHTAGLALLIFFCICFQLFYMVVGSVFYYLFADVVPMRLMGKFFAFFTLTGSAAGWLFQSYFLKYAENYAEILYTAIALLYGVFFLLMCTQVREGEYPPPDDGQAPPGLSQNIRTYFRECFSIPYYLWFFAATALNAVSGICGTLFGVFFARETLGLTLETLGKINGWSALIGVLISFPCGYWADKLHPLRLYTLSVILVIGVNVMGYFYAYDMFSYAVTALSLAIVYTIQATCTLPMFAALLPRERYGQFCSAQAIFAAFWLTVANWGGGWFIDATGDYRNIFIWDIFFTVGALIALIPVSRTWQQCGGKTNYIAP